MTKNEESKKGENWRRGYQEGYAEGYKAGVDSVLKEVEEDQRKFREGFAYRPKD